MEESGTQEETNVQDTEGQESTEEKTTEGQEPTADSTKTKEVEPKTFDENYVKGLRAENARYRRKLRETESSIPNIVQSEVQKILYGNQGQQGYSQTGQPYQPVQQRQTTQLYDPRVDDMLLSNKLNEVKADPYFKELFNEVDEEGRTFEERLLETAVEKQWPIEELDALVFKMEKAKILGKSRQSAIDEAYKSMSQKAQGSAEKNVSSGKNVEEGEVNNVDDAVKKAMKEHGVTSLSDLR